MAQRSLFILVFLLAFASSSFAQYPSVIPSLPPGPIDWNNLPDELKKINIDQLPNDKTLKQVVDEFNALNPLKWIDIYTNIPTEVRIRGSLSYGLIHGIAYIEKQKMQTMFDTVWLGQMTAQLSEKVPGKKIICSSPDKYLPNEYHIGFVNGEKKYVMVRDNNHCEHIINTDLLSHIGGMADKKDRFRQFDIPLELNRAFPVQSIGDFSLLNPDKPGFAQRPFEVTHRSFGDTLIKIIPEDNKAYVHICQFFPGASLSNPNFALEYVYSKMLNLSVTLTGRLGAVKFDALRMCSLTKIEHVPNKQNISGIIDVEVPNTYNMERIPLVIQVATMSWLLFVILALVIAAMLALIPAVAAAVIAFILVALAAIIAAIGILSSSILTKYANQWIDQQISSSYGIKLEDLNSKVWARAVLNSEQMKNFRGVTGPCDGGKCKDGTWSYELLTQHLINNQVMIGQASAEISYEELMNQFIAERERVRVACASMVGALTNHKLPDNFQKILEGIVTEGRILCDSISETSVSINTFLPNENSRKAGCYDNFIRLEDVTIGNIEILNELLEKLKIDGGKYSKEVEAAIRERLTSKVTHSTATNWWAQKGANQCGFDTEIKITLPKLPQTQLLSCIAQKSAGHQAIDDKVALSILFDCDIVNLQDIKDLINRLGGITEKGLDELERHIPQLRQYALAHPELKRVLDDIEQLIPDLRKRLPK